MPRSDGACRVCSGFEPQTIDRLLVVGHGVRFVSERWGIPRWVVKRHRDVCLVGDRLAATEADLARLAAKPGVGGGSQGALRGDHTGRRALQVGSYRG